MKLLSNIPRGLIVFLGVIILLLMLVLGYRALSGGGSTSSGSGNTNGFFSALFPFSNPFIPANTTTGASSTPLTQSQEGGVPVLREVSADPVSGGWFAANPGATSTPLIRYMDRESGHVSETAADSAAQKRISNTTVPGMEELHPVSDSTVIVRSYASGKVQNFLGTVNATSSEQSLALTVIPSFDRVATEQDAGTWLSVTKVSTGSRMDIAKPGAATQTVFASPIVSWVPIISAGRVFLETAPSAGAAGYLYELKDGGLAKVAGGLTGLTATVSPSGRYAAYSGDTTNGFALYVLDTKTGSVSETPLPATTLKCAWVPGHEPLLFCAVPTDPPAASYPDDWLLGNVSFSDDAWVINPQKSTAYFIGTLTDQDGIGLDAENILIDPSGAYALFMNKKDLSLWSLWISDAVARGVQ